MSKTKYTARQKSNGEYRAIAVTWTEDAVADGEIFEPPTELRAAWVSEDGVIISEDPNWVGGYASPFAAVKAARRGSRR